jgi:hypothetical protein
MRETRLLAGAVGVLLAAVLVWTFWWRPGADPAEAPENIAPLGSRPTSATEGPATEAATIGALNAPARAITDDVRLLQDVFVQWQTNFAATGNPVGTNAEITAALCGDNALNLDLIPRNHPAINKRGELCDRWGTPFRFHQRSGTDMEIISAGPDRDFATADDVTVP